MVPAPGGMIAGREMAAHVAARDGIRDERPDDGDDHPDNDLREPTLHGETMPDPNGETMKAPSMNRRPACFPSVSRWRTATALKGNRTHQSKLCPRSRREYLVWIIGLAWVAERDENA